MTIRDVARRAGVGVGTVSRVLNSSPAVSEPTREKVLAAIEELDFRPSTIARRLSLGKTLTIAVIVPFFTRPAMVERLRGIELTLTENEYDMVLYNVETVERRDSYFRELPRSDRLDGQIIISLPPGDDEAERFLRAQAPVVLLDAFQPELHRILVDDLNGGWLATRHLIGLGHERIAFISDYLENPFRFRSNRNRFEGYLMALDEANLPFLPHYHQQGEHSQIAGRALARKLLTMPERPTAIFAASDTMAIGVLAAARELGIRIPQELSVIGFDDIELAGYMGLTTISQPLFELGVAGAELMMELLEKPRQPVHESVMPVDLVERATTAVWPPA